MHFYYHCRVTHKFASIIYIYLASILHLSTDIVANLKRLALELEIGANSLKFKYMDNNKRTARRMKFQSIWTFCKTSLGKHQRQRDTEPSQPDLAPTQIPIRNFNRNIISVVKPHKLRLSCWSFKQPQCEDEQIRDDLIEVAHE